MLPIYDDEQMVLALVSFRFLSTKQMHQAVHYKKELSYDVSS